MPPTADAASIVREAWSGLNKGRGVSLLPKPADSTPLGW